MARITFLLILLLIYILIDILLTKLTESNMDQIYPKIIKQSYRKILLYEYIKCKKVTILRIVARVSDNLTDICFHANKIEWETAIKRLSVWSRTTTPFHRGISSTG